MKELKFRVWANTDNGLEMIYLDNCECDNGLWFASEKHIDEYSKTIMQFTGLKDKNGKDIYEGDVVTFKTAEQGKESDYYEKRETVVFYRAVFSIGSGNLYEWSHEQGGLDMPLKNRHYISYGAKNTYMIDFDIEVVGNIYDTPIKID